MKTKTFILTFFILFSHIAFGQSDSLSFEYKIRLPYRDCAHSHICCQTTCPCCPNFPLDSLQIKFAQQIYSLEKTYLRETINPTDTIVYLQSAIDHISKIKNIDVFDGSSKLVYSKSLYFVSNQNIRLDLTHLRSGVYFIRIRTEQDIFSSKLIIKNE